MSARGCVVSLKITTGIYCMYSNLEMTHVRACVLLAGPSACHCVWYIVQDEEDHAAALYRPLYE